MTTPLPPLNEPNSDTERGYAQNTRPNPTINPPPPTGQPTRSAPTPPMARGGHVQTTGQPRRVPPPTGGGRPVSPPPRQDAFYLPWWSVVAMLLVVLVVAFSIVGLIVTLGSNPPSAITTPIIRIITAVPTLANNAVAVPTVAPIIQISNNPVTDQLALQGPTLEAVVFTPTPQPVLVGSNVVVAGVEQEQLNVRDLAGVQGTTILFRAVEGDLFVVVDGPNQADGFTWWKIQSLVNPSQTGWAVSNYLQVVTGQ